MGLRHELGGIFRYFNKRVGCLGLKIALCFPWSIKVRNVDTEKCHFLSYNTINKSVNSVSYYISVSFNMFRTMKFKTEL